MTTNILAVEDEPAIRDMIRYSLEREGYQVITANDVGEARQVVAEHVVDLALVDWMLPDASGLEFVRFLRREPLTQRLPIVVLTARSEEQDITRGLDAGAHRAQASDTPLTLGHTEFKLLQFLMQHPERVYSRTQLLDHVWGPNTYIEERTIDVHVLRLRKILKPFALDGMIQTVRGAGYRFSAVSD